MSFCTAFTKKGKCCRAYACINENRCHKHTEQNKEEWKKKFLSYYTIRYNWFSSAKYKNKILYTMEKEKPKFIEKDMNGRRRYFDIYLLLLEYDYLDIELMYKCLNPYLLVYIWRQHTDVFILSGHSQNALSILLKKGGPKMVSEIMNWLNAKIIRLLENPPSTMVQVLNSFFLSLTAIPSLKELVFYDLEKSCINSDTEKIVKESFNSYFLPAFKQMRTLIKKEMKRTKAVMKEEIVAEVFHPMYIQKYMNMGYTLDEILYTIW